MKATTYTTPEYDLTQLQTSDWIAGIDETGRGSFAGPLMVCAYVTTAEWIHQLPPVRDSKKLTENQREMTSLSLRPYPHWLVTRTAEQIDTTGIDAQQRSAVAELLEILATQLPGRGVVVIDGAPLPLPPPRSSVSIVYAPKAEDLSVVVAAASIVAKVCRDAIVARLPKADLYDWANNSGYGTPGHLKLIRQHGLDTQHRRSFLTKYQHELAGWTR